MSWKWYKKSHRIFWGWLWPLEVTYIFPTLLCAVFSHSVASSSLRSHWLYSPSAPLSMRFPRQEYWSGFPCSPSGDLPDLEIKPMSPALTGGFFTTGPPGKPRKKVRNFFFLIPVRKWNLIWQHVQTSSWI